MAEPTRRRGGPEYTEERRLRRSWLSLILAFGSLAALTALELVVSSDLLRPLIVGLVVITGVAGLFHRRVLADLEHGRRTESESFQRILQGLSRSVSPDAIVEAIVEDLGVAAGADHTVVVRLRADARILEATLVSSRARVPSSTTMLPLSDLEDPGPASRIGRRAPIAIPIERSSGSDGLVGRTYEWQPVAVAAAPAVERKVDSLRGGIAVARPRLRDRAIAGARSGEAPFDEWEAEPAIATRPRPASLDLLRASVADRLTETQAIAGPAEAAERIAEQLAARVRAVYGLKNTLATALVTDQGVVGAIVLSRRMTDTWSPATLRLVRASAEEASAALARAYSHRDAEARASTDALTGLPNRRYFEEFCGLLARRRRADDAVGVLMIDIDHFKRLNDTFGHLVGDQVLRAVAGAIAGAVREGDVPARFGGEEFAVLLRNPGTRVAMEVGERVRAAVGNLDLTSFGPTGVTVSVGVAIAHSADQPISALVDEADHALYRAKRLGRDRVVAAA